MAQRRFSMSEQQRGLVKASEVMAALNCHAFVGRDDME